ncbi:unnamed protein product [Haemonchus placei]|uniref:Secreted protein n=1 Tax=Haemonchus placei TaxID=6290 RepID=A0A0N4WQR8_HAEPC|nr:unnamed protein product [Haemonchus placei]
MLFVHQRDLQSLLSSVFFLALMLSQVSFVRKMAFITEVLALEVPSSADNFT